MMKRGIALVTLMVMCLSLLIACGSQGGGVPGTPSGGTPGTPPDTPNSQGNPPPPPIDENVRYAEEITIITDGIAVPHLNPLNTGAITPGILWAFKMGWDRLIDSVDGQYVPMLATEWKTEDMKTWVFNLRDDVYFHNGDKFTAEDVVYTATKGKETIGAMGYSTWGFVEKATALDEYTVEIVLSDINVEFEFYLSMGEALILNERAIAEDPENGNLVGTGAFHVTEFVSNNYWILERNDSYWGEAPITRKVTFRQVAEPGTRTIMMLNGEAQLSFSIPAEDQELFIDKPAYTTFRHTLNNPNPILFNMSHPITGDWNFRMAVASALNREEIVAATGARYYILPTNGGMYGYEQAYRNESIPLIPEDPEKAKEYLAASSYNGETIIITAAITSFVRAAEVIQQQLNRIGIKSEINQVDTPAIPSMIQWGNNQSQIIITGYAIGTNEAALRSELYPRLAHNWTSYDNPKVTALFDEAAIEPDREKRKEIYLEIQRIVSEDPPWFLLWHSERIIFGAKGIGGFALRADAFYDLRYIYQQID